MIITFLCALPHVDYMLSLIHAAPNHPSPLAYSVLVLLVTSLFTLLFLLSLLCHRHFRCHRYFHHTVTTNKLLPSTYLSGAVELTTQLLKLINILWLPLCRIYKLGYSYPRRLLRSPTLVGHQWSRFPDHETLIVCWQWGHVIRRMIWWTHTHLKCCNVIQSHSSTLR